MKLCVLGRLCDPDVRGGHVVALADVVVLPTEEDLFPYVTCVNLHCAFSRRVFSGFK